MVGSAEGRGVAEGVKGPNWDGGSGPLMTGEAGPPGSGGVRRCCGVLSSEWWYDGVAWMDGDDEACGCWD